MKVGGIIPKLRAIEATVYYQCVEVAYFTLSYKQLYVNLDRLFFFFFLGGGGGGKGYSAPTTTLLGACPLPVPTPMQ